MRRNRILILVSASGAEISNSPCYRTLSNMQKYEPGSRIMLYSRWLAKRKKEAEANQAGQLSAL